MKNLKAESSLKNITILNLKNRCFKINLKLVLGSMTKRKAVAIYNKQYFPLDAFDFHVKKLILLSFMVFQHTRKQILSPITPL